MGIQSAALTTMGRSYGLPTMAAGCATDAHDIGPEACIEKLITMLPSISAGADIVVGFGELDGDQTLVLEQILVDNELAHLVLRMFEGVDGREGAELFEDVAEVGPGRQLPGDARDPHRVTQRRVLRAGADRPRCLRRVAHAGEAHDVRAGTGPGPGDPRRTAWWTRWPTVSWPRWTGSWPKRTRRCARSRGPGLPSCRGARRSAGCPRRRCVPCTAPSRVCSHSPVVKRSWPSTAGAPRSGRFPGTAAATCSRRITTRTRSRRCS